MILVIRLTKFGNLKKPFYKIALFNNLSGRQSKFFVEFGYYDPLKKKIYVNKNLINNFIKFGSQMSNIVRHILFKLIL